MPMSKLKVMLPPKRWTDNELGLEWLERNFEKHSKNM